MCLMLSVLVDHQIWGYILPKSSLLVFVCTIGALSYCDDNDKERQC